MGVCCVDGCDADDSDGITYFPFPIKPALRRKWREAIRTSTKIHDDSKVCSKHFNETDYEEIRGKMRLKGRVVPSIFHYLKNEAPKSPEKPKPASPAPVEDQAARAEEVLATPDFLMATMDPGLDESAENCTIECVPEAVLNHDTDTSEPELDKHGDIEDIIANYHIKQNKKLAQRLKAEAENLAREKEREAQKDRDKDCDKNEGGGKKDDGKSENVGNSKDDRVNKGGRKDDDDEDCFEVKQTIEISVGQEGGRASPADCLMVLENVQVDIDPRALLPPDGDDGDRKEDPISLLTSSDDSDVILEEPHIDTVEVSSETDEDDQPLVRLIKDKDTKSKEVLGRILWGSMHEYTCYECKYTTTSCGAYLLHKTQHDKIIYVCDVCQFASGSKLAFSRHKRLHKMEKRFKCHLCEYRARHHMALIYHLKSHDGVSARDIPPPKPKFTVKNSYKCSDCHFQTDSKKAMLKHVKNCKTTKDDLHRCELCEYVTKRKSDLKRHRTRRHESREET